MVASCATPMDDQSNSEILSIKESLDQQVKFVYETFMLLFVYLFGKQVELTKGSLQKQKKTV